MLNFDYLKDIPELATLYRYCDNAEKHQIDDPEISAINSRRALEWMARAIYQMKGEEIGERWTLFQIVDNETFRDFFDNGDRIMMAVHYIRKVGNSAAHDGQKVTKKESFFSLLNLYNFVGAVLLRLRVLETLAPFDKELIPSSAHTIPTSPVEKETVEEFVETVEPAQIESAENTPTEEIYEKLSWDSISEAETRRLYIDMMLREAGWDILEDNGDKQPGKACKEIELKGLPTNSGKGYADYVLYGKDSRPLAVIEAKRTSVNPADGRHQAELYAAALEKEYGVKPVIYYTNGYELWVIDGLGYPPRRLYGFHSIEDLERILKRRGRKDITDMAENPNIAGRHYQLSGIKALCEHFNKKYRRGLLVMATGTGKTRTAISLVDVLTRANWVKNTLFLADRNSLVNQAHKAFAKLLPDMPTTVLSDRDKNPDMNARIMFSTYQTMINHIETDEKTFSIGRFDLIIIDEAHRSVFGKFGAIFKYFDSLLVGLTATPREEVERSTYELLGLEEGIPNYAYEEKEAVEDGYLVPAEGKSYKSAVLEEGIKYDDLSEGEKEELEKVWEYEGAVNAVDPNPRDILKNEIYNYIFNIDTVDKVLQELMENGIKIHSGEMIGKTIIFAYNKEHAQLIVERFNHLYPDYGPEFCARIDYSVKYSQDLIDKFGVRDKLPQIAVSVDMLDTGIDVPDVLNLVFFKRVRSKIKFMQMKGRGTRLSPDIFAPGEDKKKFMIFDWLGNFEFFNPGIPQPKSKRSQSLSERIFGARADIAAGLQSARYQEDEFAKNFHDELKSILLEQVKRLNDHHIAVRDKWASVSRFRQPEAWQYLSAVDVLTLKNDVAPLVSMPGEDETALKFDLLVLYSQLGMINPDFESGAFEGKITVIANALQKLGSVPEVMAKMPLIKEVLTKEFWDNKKLSSLEKVRIELRDLIKHLTGEPDAKFTVNIKDTVSEGEAIPTVITDVTYRQKVLEFLTENRDLPVLQKIRNIEQLSGEDIKELERILWSELGSKEDYERYLQREKLDEGLNVAGFIRTLNGIDRQKALQLFTQFIQAHTLTSEQEEYLKSILDYVCQNGDIEKQQLIKAPFTEFNPIDLFGGKFPKVAEFVTLLHKSISVA